MTYGFFSSYAPHKWLFAHTLSSLVTIMLQRGYGCEALWPSAEAPTPGLTIFLFRNKFAVDSTLPRGMTILIFAANFWRWIRRTGGPVGPLPRG